MKFIWSHSTSHLRTRNFKWQKLKLVVFLKFLFLIEFIFEEYNLGENSSESSEITWLVTQMLTSRAVQSVLFISSQKRILQHKPKSSRTISWWISNFLPRKCTILQWRKKEFTKKYSPLTKLWSTYALPGRRYWVKSPKTKCILYRLLSIQKKSYYVFGPKTLGDFEEKKEFTSSCP